MIAIILCAGYGTRLYPFTLNKPKALLPVRAKPLLSHIIQKVSEIKEIERIFVVTNDKFYRDFVEWLGQNGNDPKISIVNDGTHSDKERLGGVGDLWFTIERERISDDVIVILGDNYFDFDLKRMIEYFREVNDTVLGVHEILDRSVLAKMGVVGIENRKLTSFHDRPDNPESNFASTGIYLFTKSDLKRIGTYMKTGKPKDGPGFLIKDWVHSKEVHAFPLDGMWTDIGSLESYEKVNFTGLKS